MADVATTRTASVRQLKMLETLSAIPQLGDQRVIEAWYRWRADTDARRLSVALIQVVEASESLRSRFLRADDGSFVVVVDPPTRARDLVTLGSSPETRPSMLPSESQFRVYVDEPAGEMRIFVGHFVFDAVSMRQLLAEVSKAYHNGSNYRMATAVADYYRHSDAWYEQHRRGELDGFARWQRQHLQTYGPWPSVVLPGRGDFVRVLDERPAIGSSRQLAPWALDATGSPAALAVTALARAVDTIHPQMTLGIEIETAGRWGLAVGRSIGLFTDYVTVPLGGDARSLSIGETISAISLAVRMHRYPRHLECSGTERYMPMTMNLLFRHERDEYSFLRRGGSAVFEVQPTQAISPGAYGTRVLPGLRARLIERDEPVIEISGRAGDIEQEVLDQLVDEWHVQLTILNTTSTNHRS